MGLDVGGSESGEDIGCGFGVRLGAGNMGSAGEGVEVV